ncbi:apolipoprotein N-acyltransferase [Tepidimonas charontis]|uniref:Apolipoprotein N-acyltransferase n=1 Tax=Tepidimonas charontis TaxID=2267262 RepID=A0A554XCX1_9BURK|nr:apolipoprotein N-acyltransferase [Tepidimonas charontis]TSE33678.1 Apolipoprotein N-acyltransferase [Tepidimonas charontis]
MTGQRAAGQPLWRREAAAWALAAAAGVAQAAAVAWPGPQTGFPTLRSGEPVAWLHGLSLIALVALLARASSAPQAGGRAFVFATAWLGGVFWWLFISMHTYGGLAAPLALVAVLALAAFLALDYGLLAALWWRWRGRSGVPAALAFAAAWTLAELARGVLWTGFPWGAGGYAQIDALGWAAPWVGVYGMGALAAALAAAVVLARTWVRALALALAALLWGIPGTGAWLAQRLPDFTAPAGALPVRLLQGAIAQDRKFDPEDGIPLALRWYGARIAEAAVDPALTAGLVVAPETAIPLLPQDLDPAYWHALAQTVRAGGAALLMGVPLGDFERGYTNSVAGWRPGGTPLPADADALGLADYRYDKHHLVPFGEFIPPGFRWFVDLMRMPLGDFQRGGLPQPPFEWAGQRIAPHVCYEDLFGEELAQAFRDPARAPTVLVNVSNIAWFGDTVAIDQHRQIARLRALELGRPMLRATNTGATVAIDHRGRVLAQWPRGQRGVLDAVVQGRQGRTPYVVWVARWGLWPLALTCLLVWGWVARRRS